MAFEKPKGTQDFYPEDKALINALSMKCRAVASAYSFNEVETPAFESTSLLYAKSGPEIKDQIFTLDKRGSEEFGLRFDLTVPLTRMFIAKQKAMTKPVKWFSISRMWRYERPQKGRLREFYQFDVELLGSDKEEADAEIISLLIDTLLSFGLTEKDFFIKLNNRYLLTGLLSDFVPKEKIEEVLRLIDKSSKISKEDFIKSLEDLEVDAQRVEDMIKIKEAPETALQKIEALKLNEKAKKGFDSLKQVLSKLDPEYLKYIKLDLSISRGLAYYTGNVFECFDIDERFRAIAGGGRYDNMVELFGGQDTPCTGFAMGFETLSLVLDERGLLPKPDLGPEYFIAPVSEEMFGKATGIAKKLRNNGRKTDIDLSGRNLSNQISYASSLNAKQIIIVGKKDADDEVTVKDLKSGEEKKVKIDQL